MCVCVCVCVCVRARARACISERERERACVRACVCVSPFSEDSNHPLKNPSKQRQLRGFCTTLFKLRRRQIDHLPRRQRGRPSRPPRPHVHFLPQAAAGDRSDPDDSAIISAERSHGFTIRDTHCVRALTSKQSSHLGEVGGGPGAVSYTHLRAHETG